LRGRSTPELDYEKGTKGGVENVEERRATAHARAVARRTGDRVERAQKESRRRSQMDSPGKKEQRGKRNLMVPVNAKRK